MAKRPTLKSLQRRLDLANDALEVALAASPITDDNFFPAGLSELYKDRNAWDRKKVFGEALRAWRVNPLARRIVRLITSFVVGKGLTIAIKPARKSLGEKIKSAILGDKEKASQEFLLKWWDHPLNNLRKNVKRWQNEITNTGNLFVLFSVDQARMSYVRAVPSEQIDDIQTKENDVEQELKYTKDVVGEEGWDAYDPKGDQTSFMLHFAVNQPVGSAWGEADMTPLLVWIGRFSSWLEDRVRLNRFRTAFMYVISGAYASETERSTREKQLNANPPKSGSVLVLNRSNGEAWGILSAKLDAFDASMDGVAIKKNILDGAGQPMHWHGEPESSTRTTAEAAGTPSFRTLEETQSDFFDILTEIARVALQVKARADKKINAEVEIEIKGPDITERDNASLALALMRSYPALSDLFDRKLIDENQLLDLAFRMIAEPFEGGAPKGLRKDVNKPAAGSKDAPSPDPNAKDPADPQEPADA